MESTMSEVSGEFQINTGGSSTIFLDAEDHL
jgi:hypothetical protein